MSKTENYDEILQNDKLLLSKLKRIPSKFLKIIMRIFKIPLPPPVVQYEYKQLNSDQWAEHYNKTIIDSVVDSITKENLFFQTIEMLKLTSVGEKVLEIGCGSGQTSLYLSLKNRMVTALDFSKQVLELLNIASVKLHCHVETIFADATELLPFQEDEFDVVFQAGLLEHFEKEERALLLKRWGKVGKRMISIIPNAASLAYRVGKAQMEKDGTWEYGKELPQYSLYQEFYDAGFQIINEYTIGEAHSLNFLPEKHYLRMALQKWQQENICGDNCGQGYLLVTVGKK
jgi:ubiquinone/menaquinone biosynthesis C-methylase UbiE